ncbi:hypothetical protein [Candidatus Palauibacter sp.]|uniref:hypothetical protein n=1 Tax=Candidatus Palauibacter sp. TaxID=3101350 RepID=UPI003B51F96C
MWGRSHGSLTQWLSAPLGSQHLTCMAPHVICDDHFGDCHYLGGASRFSRNLNTGDDVGTGTRMRTARNTVLHSTACPSHVLLAVRAGSSG